MKLLKRLFLMLLMVTLLMQFASCNVQETEQTATPPTTNPTTDPTAEPTVDLTPTPSPSIPTPEIPEFDTYANPLITSRDYNARKNNGIGDPFVLRWNGKYYMYCSSGGVGIQCWVSEDLVNWTFTGDCATDTTVRAAYAPEVVYYNGSFYMYTSPNGNGHYVLKSDAPTGPFEVISENLGLGIDGHVFVDDDGSWHFYRAYDNGIAVYEMSAPNDINAESQSHIKLDMFDNRYCWTEGPMVVKYDGAYYLTYAGNHVWSAAYRIHYALSKDSPTEFTPGNNNPLLLSTDKNTVRGIGHSSTVLGPNLDEYYIVYHSFKTMGLRDMNIDRLVFNGTNTVSLGPTVSKQQVPAMPDLYNRFESQDDFNAWNITNGEFKNGALVLSDGGMALSTTKLGQNGDYTAEYNLKSLTSKAGIIFGYTDNNNYGKAVYNAENGKLIITITVNGQSVENEVAIKASFGESLNAAALNTFKVHKNGSRYVLYLNDKKVYECQSDLADGYIGVICQEGTAAVGFVGGTNGVLQSTLKDVYKPADANIPAFTCNQNNVTLKDYDGANYLQMLLNNTYSYNVNVNKGGKHDLVLNYIASAACTLEVYQGAQKLGEVTLTASPDATARKVYRGFELAQGAGTITFVVKDGNADMLDISFHQAEDVTEVTYDFTNSSDVTPYHNYDKWSIKDGLLTFEREYGKYMIGSENWGDYIVEADITPTSDSINVGMCVRVSNPASFEDGNKQKYFGGTYYMQGYYVGFTNNSIVLAKLNYDWQELQTVEFATTKDTTYNVKIQVIDNNILVTVDGTQVFNYTDNDAPFLHGMMGFRTHESHVTVDNVVISPIKND